MFKRSVLLFLAALLIAAGLLPPTHSIQAQDGERLQVVASFSILADVVSNVAGDAADVTSLMPLFANPHSFIPAPQDLVTLAEADVIFTVGANFEEGLAETIENAGDDLNIVVASNCIEILPFGLAGDDHDHEAGEDHDHEADEDHDHEEGEDHDHEGEMSEIAAQCEAHHEEMAVLHGHDHEASEDHEGEEAEHEHDHDHGAEPLGMLYTLACGGHEHEGEESGEEHAHEAGSCDPHVWTDPHNAMFWAMMARDTLSELDPANADTYAANASAYIETLDAMTHGDWRELVDTIPEADRKLVTNHGAFGYFANLFDFEVVGLVIPAASTSAEAGARDVADLIDTIRAEEVRAVFAETTSNPDLARQVADETGVTFLTLYTGTLSEADGPASTYIDYLTYNIETIIAGLSGVED